MMVTCLHCSEVLYIRISPDWNVNIQLLTILTQNRKDSNITRLECKYVYLIHLLFVVPYSNITRLECKFTTSAS